MIYVFLTILLGVAGSFLGMNSTVNCILYGVIGSLCPVTYLLYKIYMNTSSLLNKKEEK